MLTLTAAVAATRCQYWWGVWCHFLSGSMFLLGGPPAEAGFSLQGGVSLQEGDLWRLTEWLTDASVNITFPYGR